jgi:hypothetical protein
MKRLSRKLSVLCLLVASPSYGNGYTEMVSTFISVTKSILLGGDALFDQLAATQTLHVSDDLYSEATNLENAKKELRTKIDSSNTSCRDIHQAVPHLEQQVRNLAWTLDRFSKEIDKVSGLTSGPLRVATHQLLSDKLRELQEMERLCWDRGPQPLDATAKETLLGYLDAAVADTVKLQNASSCLSKTLKEKKAACDPNRL